MKRTVLVALSAMAALSLAARHVTSEQGARALDETFARAARAGDLEGIMKLYAADAVLFPPGEKEQKGYSAIRDEWKDFLRRAPSKRSNCPTSLAGPAGISRRAGAPSL